jgi:molybdopterin synthase sulfur carrier subunit
MKILFFAHLKDVTGCARLELDCDAVDADGLWHRLTQLHPRLEAFRGFVRLARNSEYVGPDAIFFNGDEVALIPPVSGG